MFSFKIKIILSSFAWYHLVLCEYNWKPPDLPFHFLNCLVCQPPLLLLLTEWALVIILSSVIRLDHEYLAVVLSIGHGRLLGHWLRYFFFFIKAVAELVTVADNHCERLLLIVLLLGFIVILCNVCEDFLNKVLHFMYRPHLIILLLLLNQFLLLLLLLALLGGASFDL